MVIINRLESILGSLFDGLPKLSNSLRKSIVSVLPLLVLIGSLLQCLIVVKAYMWSLGIASSQGAIPVLGIGFWIYLSSVIIIGVLLFASYARLKKYDKYGWDLLFMIPLLNVLVSVFALFVDGAYGVHNFVSNVLVSGLGMYLLFQIRGFYTNVEVGEQPENKDAEAGVRDQVVIRSETKPKVKSKSKTKTKTKTEVDSKSTSNSKAKSKSTKD